MWGTHARPNSMDRETILQLLEDVREEKLSPEGAMERLKMLPFEDAGIAKIDHHRTLRLGLPEVIYAAGKTPDDTAEIFSRMAAHGGNVLATRAGADHAVAVQSRVPNTVYRERARTISLIRDTTERGKGVIAILCAG